MQVIAVPLESRHEAASRWSKEFQIGFPVLFDPQQEIGRAYNATAIPYFAAIDREGKVSRVVVGADIAALESAVEQLAAGA